MMCGVLCRRDVTTSLSLNESSRFKKGTFASCHANATSTSFLQVAGSRAPACHPLSRLVFPKTLSKIVDLSSNSSSEPDTYST